MKYLINYRSCAGTVHNSVMKKNQDSVCIVNEGDFFAAALADGAGSHIYADVGSDTAVKTVCRYLKSNKFSIFSNNIKTMKSEIINEIINQLTVEAEKRNCSSVKEFGSTLVFAVSDGNSIMTGHLGDGVISGVYNNRMSVVSFPENGKDETSTFLTTSADAAVRMRITCRKLEHFDELIMMSDGIVPYVFEKGYVLKNSHSISDLLNNAVEGIHQDDASYIEVRFKRGIK